MSEASDQITQYLSVGGLFNPEIMNQTQHEAVRDTLIKARDDIQSLERKNAALRLAAVEVCALARVWVTVWGDKISSESIKRLGELEKQVLKEAQP